MSHTTAAVIATLGTVAIIAGLVRWYIVDRASFAYVVPRTIVCTAAVMLWAYAIAALGAP